MDILVRSARSRQGPRSQEDVGLQASDPGLGPEKT